MSLKAALQADLAKLGKNLGDLAEMLGITQQSVSKWIAKDEIPKDRVEDVLAVVGPASQTAGFIVEQAKRLVRGAMGGVGLPERLRAPPQPGDDEDDTRPMRLEELRPTVYNSRPIAQVVPPAPVMPPSIQTPPLEGRRVQLFRRAFGRPSGVEPWARLLKDPLKANVLRTHEINGGLRRFDYLSDKLALMVRPVPDIDPTRLINTAMPLLLIKTRRPSIECILVLVPGEVVNAPPSPLIHRDPGTDRVHDNRRQLVKLDLMALGVAVVEVPTAQSVADLIETAEAGVMSNPPFSYEDDPDAEEFE